MRRAEWIGLAVMVAFFLLAYAMTVAVSECYGQCGDRQDYISADY